jgi:hypothetical protein
MAWVIVRHNHLLFVRAREQEKRVLYRSVGQFSDAFRDGLDTAGVGTGGIDNNGTGRRHSPRVRSGAHAVSCGDKSSKRHERSEDLHGSTR